MLTTTIFSYFLLILASLLLNILYLIISISILLLISYIANIALCIIRYFKGYYTIFKIKYPNLPNILRNFIICLCVTTLVVYSSILYFNAALSEISIESLVMQSYTITDNIFSATCPLESKPSGQDITSLSLEDLRTRLEKEKQAFEYIKTITTLKVEHMSRFFESYTKCVNISIINGKTFPVSIDNITDQDIIARSELIRGMHKSLSQDIDFLLRKINNMSIIDRQIHVVTHTNYSNDYYDNLHADIFKYKDKD